MKDLKIFSTKIRPTILPHRGTTYYRVPKFGENLETNFSKRQTFFINKLTHWSHRNPSPLP